MGMIIGIIIYYTDYELYRDHVIFITKKLHKYNKTKKQLIFDGHMFFFIILPPIIFAGGYNLKKRRFF